MQHRHHPLALLLTALGCATSGAPPASTAFAPLDVSGLPAPGGERARVLHTEQMVRFERSAEGPVAVVTERDQVQVFRAAAGDHQSSDYTQVRTAYSQTFDQIVHMAARVVKPDGRAERTYDGDDAYDAPEFPDFVLYGDDRVRGIDLPDPAPGSIIESVIVKRQRTPELFAFGHAFGGEVPVRRSRLVVEVPDGFVIEHGADAQGAPVASKPRVEQLAGMTRYTWERRDLPALEPEQYGPPPGALLEQVYLRLASWTDAAGAVHQAPADAAALSRYTHGLIKDRVQVTPEIEAQVRTLLTGVGDDPRARARRLYAWARDNIRYCAVEVGMGGFVPHGSADVEKNRYGDCKDKANLLKAMLTVAGIDSRIVTIYADMWPERFRLPVLAGNFNHAILLVDLPGGPVWVDPTTRTTPFDDLPSVDEDRLALPISARGDPLTPTLASDPARERRVSDVQLALGVDGLARGAFSLEVNGEYADGLRGRLLDEPGARHAEVIAEMLPLDDARVTRFELRDAAPPEEVTPAGARGDVQTRVTAPLRPGNDALFSARALWRPALPPLSRDRKTPVVLGARRSTTDSVSLKLPPGVSAARAPPPFEIDTPHLRYALRWEITDGVLRAARDVTVKVRVVPQDELVAFLDATERVAVAEEQKIVLHGGDQ